ncbi:Acetyltransferase (GNAT) family [Musa troglodytarum]|uniref:Acetyltransferase (GNAT) family n=1 Tax=Musa troglodytarum TaxID=320322 RepID=A0A9E7K6D8_9LILI|nr:Acetyltransferase (GNAT) family [Musa troglodytarum]
MEEWSKEKGAGYAYMATEKDNEFRTPAILVHPVLAHRLPLPPRVAILRLTPADAEALYRRRSAATEFFHRRSRDPSTRERARVGPVPQIP